MTVVIAKDSENSGVEKKLEQLEIRYQYFKENQIEDLNVKTRDWIYLVDSTRSSNWAKLRVNLAQANRHHIVYGNHLDSGKVVQAMKDGAYDVLDLTDSAGRWKKVLQKTENAQQLWLQLYVGGPTRDRNVLVGHSPAIEALNRTIERVGPTDASVLIAGESGVGKERTARALHQRGPFVVVNCAAIPRDLLEAELFGSVKGAYTGSTTERQGLVREANKGTLFLDEIGEMSLELQPKLLRFLEARRARPLGSGKEYKAEVRILSATNRDLQKMANDGHFRLDLYFRLSEVVVRVPALRERTKDIPVLARIFMREACERFGKNFEAIEPELLSQWQSYSWPGNVRELKHVIEQLIIFYDGPILREGWWRVPEAMTHSALEGTTGEVVGKPRARPTSILEHLQDVTQEFSGNSGPTVSLLNRKQKLTLAKRLLEDSGDDYSWVASQLGVHPTTLYRWRVKHRL